jgi:hypothetical protein
VEPDYGSLSFDSNKSIYKLENHMGKFIEILIKNLTGVEIDEFSKKETKLDANTVSAYRTKLNERLKKSWEDGELKIFIYIDSIKKNNRQTKYLLRAYRFAPKKTTDTN